MARPYTAHPICSTTAASVPVDYHNVANISEKYNFTVTASHNNADLAQKPKY